MMKNLTSANATVLGLILSGGRGQRLGGVDKGLQNYQGMALIDHVIRAVEPQVSKTLICINRNKREYKKRELELVFDRNERSQIQEASHQNTHYQGPVAGIVAAYDWLQANKANYDYVLIASCDSPNLPSDYVARLTSALNSASTTVANAVVHDGMRKQNLHCVIRSDALADLAIFFDQGGRAIRDWHKKTGLIEVDFSDQASCFENLNYLEQLN